MQVYVALSQGASPASGTYRLVARTADDPMRMEHVVRRVFHEVDPGSPVYHVKSLEGYFSGRLADRTFALALLGFFGVLALALAGVGIYGVISYSVALRTRELGIRVALGAGRRDLVLMVFRESLTLALAGLAIGPGVSLLLTRLLTGLLFEVQPTDAATLLVVALVLASTALVIPARRAATVDPITALRRE